ncbi:MAG: hypothetical protein IKL10_02330 [Clostridia bacterium]|nr:hypothetical protein [Clostridia bacterium]
MTSTNQKKNWSLDTVAEIVGDLLCFDLILEIKRKMKNEEAKAYLGSFLRILAPVYVHEIANALDRLGIVSKDKLLEPTISKRINAERQLSAHKVIVNSNEATKAIEEMGISFARKVYDINIIAKNGILYDLNFESQVSPVEDFDFWNYLFCLPHTMLTAAFSTLSPDFSLQEIYDKSSSKLDTIAIQLDEVLSFSRYSYSAQKLFQHTVHLETLDKILILYRYRMITSINVLSKYLPNFQVTMGKRQIADMSLFLDKYRALIITIMGDELCQLDSSFANQIKIDIKNFIVDSSFFSLNRKLRNNLHYETTNILTEEERYIIRQNQMTYLSIFENSFRANLFIDIDKECEIMTGFSNAFRTSGMTKEELDRYYYFYYIKYRITGKL